MLRFGKLNLLHKCMHFVRNFGFYGALAVLSMELEIKSEKCARLRFCSASP